MNAVDERLAQAFADEPPLGDAIDAVFRRAEQVRRGRLRRLLLAGLLAVVLVTALGCALTTVLLPSPVHRATAAAPVPAGPDPIGGVLAEITGLTVLPHPAGGPGWRQYIALDDRGRSHGLIAVLVYDLPNGLCLPVLADQNACALAEHAAASMDYARYAWDTDPDRQVNEVIARRRTDGRTIAVMATGERAGGDAQSGRPPLSGLQTAKAATDPRIVDGFAVNERCNDPAAACPGLTLPVPVSG
jgi:hypothetical protein